MSLPPRPGLVDGREELLAELDARLTGGHGTGPRVVALYGLGGAGKTSVALEYAYRHLAEVGAAWYFPAEDPTVLAAGFAELAAQLGAREVVDARDPVKSVHAVLAAYPTVAADIPQCARPGVMGPFLPSAGRGRVVITSGYPFWSPGQALEVPAWAATRRSRSCSGAPADQDQVAAGELAAELGGLPLALERAAAYIQASGDSLGATCHCSGGDARRCWPAARRPGPQTVATVWTLAFEDLQQRAPSAVGLLRLLAYCAPEAIPLRLLLHPAPVSVTVRSRGCAGAGAAAGRSSSARRHRGAASVLARHPRGGRAGLGPPASAGRDADRCLRNWPVSGDGPLPRWWRPRFPRTVRSRMPGQTSLRCCRTPRRHSLRITTVWRASPFTLGTAAVTQPPATFSGVVEARVQVLGPEHPDTLTARTTWPSGPGSGGRGRGPRPGGCAAACLRAGPRP